MINTIHIIVTSAMLVLGSDVHNPIPYCTVQVQTQEPQPRPEYDLFEAPDGGCKGLGSKFLAATQEQFPGSAVILTVDGESHHKL